jgi:hypothetical protein
MIRLHHPSHTDCAFTDVEPDKWMWILRDCGERRAMVAMNCSDIRIGDWILCEPTIRVRYQECVLVTAIEHVEKANPLPYRHQLN